MQRQLHKYKVNFLIFRNIAINVSRQEDRPTGAMITLSPGTQVYYLSSKWSGKKPMIENL